MYQKIILLFSNIKLIHVFFLLLLIKVLTIYNVHINRELPIGPDDAFYYIAQSNLNFNNDINSKIENSIRDFVETSIVEDKNHNLVSEDLFEISGYLKNIYFMYSKLFHSVQKIFSIDKIQLWWIFNYVCQILIFISFICLTKTYMLNEKKFSKKLALIGSFFLVLSVPHQITATPMTWGSCFYLISIYLIFHKKKLLNFLGICLNLISFYFHPGVFLISLIFIMSYGSMFILYRNKENRLKFIKILLPLSIYIFFEYFLKFYHNNSNYNVNIFSLLIKSNEENLFNIFEFNYKRSFIIFTKSIIPFIPFFLKYFFLPIYIYSVFLILKKNKELFFLNIFSITMIIVGCFYKISSAHPGHINYYLSQVTSPVIFITLFYMYEIISEKIDKKFNLKKSFTITVIALIIYLPNSFRYYEILQYRSQHQNFENIMIELKKINLENSQNAIAIGDRLTLAIFSSYFNDINIYLDDKIRNNNYWSHQNKYNLIGYISLKRDESTKISKSVFISRKKYTFKYIKIFEDFYFLHNFETL